MAPLPIIRGVKDEFLTVDEAAKRLKVTPWTLREWLKAGKVRGVKISRQWRISERTLTELATGEPVKEGAAL